MAFNLPTSKNPMSSNANTNRGSFRSGMDTGLKTAGNFPITEDAPQISNGSGERGIYFGIAGQNSSTAFNGSANDKVLLTSWQSNAPNRIQVDTVANRGVVFRLASGTGNDPSDFIEFNIAGNDTPAGSARETTTICASLDASGFDNDGGNYNPSAATTFGFGNKYVGLVGSGSSVSYIQRVYVFDSSKGHPDLPTFTGTSSFEDAVDAVQGTDYTNKIGSWLVQLGSAFFIPCPFSIGNSTSATNFNDNGSSVISPSDNAAKQENFRLTDNAMKVHLNMRDNAADSVTLSGNYTWGTAAEWNFNESNASTCLLSGNFTGMGTFNLGSSVTATGTFNLSTGKAVISVGANIDSISVNGALEISTDAVTSFTGISADTLDFDTAGTYTLSGCTIGVVTNSSGGAVTIQNNLSTITTNTGPNITIEAPPKTLTVQVSQTGADVVILQGGTSTVLASVDAQAGNDFVFTYAGAQVVDIGVIKQGFGIKYTYGYNLTGDNQTLPVALLIDRAYQ